MSVQNRKRTRLFKWGGTILTVLLLTAWMVSIRLRVYLSIGATSLYLAGGAVGCDPRHRDFETFKWFDFGWSMGWEFMEELPLIRFSPQLAVRVPLLIPFLIVAIATAYLWERDRRAPRGHCVACGYDLTGNTSGVCPECGAPAPSGPGPLSDGGSKTPS